METISLPHDHGQGEALPLAHMPPTEDFDTVAELFKLLADTSRVRLFWILCHCEACVINLSAMMGMSSPAVSHHLKLLRAYGLIVSRRDGKEVYYKAGDTALVRQLHEMAEQVLEITCPTH